MTDKKTTAAAEAIKAANEVLSKVESTMMELFPGLLMENVEEAIRMEREAIAAAMPELKRQIASASACVELAGKSLLEGKEIDDAEGINREILLFVIQFRLYMHAPKYTHRN